MATQHYPAFGNDAWSRAALRVIALAGAQGRRLDWAALSLYDVRDLQALAWQWQRRDATQPGAARWWQRLRPRPRASPATFPHGPPQATGNASQK